MNLINFKNSYMANAKEVTSMFHYYCLQFQELRALKRHFDHSSSVLYNTTSPLTSTAVLSSTMCALLR